MPYDPSNPASIFHGDNLFQFAVGLNNAHAIRLGVGGDVTRPDLGICMEAVAEAQMTLSATPAQTTYCWGCNTETTALEYVLSSWLCRYCVKALEGVVRA